MDKQFNEFETKDKKIFINEKEVKAVKNFEMKKGRGNLIEVTLTFDAVPRYE
ncbi:hypothetical protein HYH11_01905 [Lactobacillus salivarius]|uniref:hypothetical protein n=1 Tax=Ligilactobacillus salivarius TaxID=1624 RepID=UPI0015C6128E|nr:hypothetical protein [Ligilactobacillus salivarius]NXZ96749.1 hypothetical protein [Ligilactobacillus salivarius]NYA62031.1 hypothetical protein [Ligilactobacillus salivarius]NYA69239.1 hypothetical protein [Ligilactobacillus salivarius]NYA73159.1 hypothetical protein [Ligilactobacillus salivarius]